MSDEQRCGNCRWWNFTRTNVSMFGGDRHWGVCNAPFPESTIMPSRAAMRDNDGEDCPCYERKERDDLERHAAE